MMQFKGPIKITLVTPGDKPGDPPKETEIEAKDMRFEPLEGETTETAEWILSLQRSFIEITLYFLYVDAFIFRRPVGDPTRN